MKKIVAFMAASASLAAASGAVAQETTPAAPTNLNGLAGLVDFSQVNTSVLSIGAAVIGVLVVIRGIKWVQQLVRS